MAEVQFEGFVEEEEGIVTIAECGNQVRTRMLCETEKKAVLRYVDKECG